MTVDVDKLIDEKIDEATALAAEKIKSELRALLARAEAQFAPLLKGLDAPLTGAAPATSREASSKRTALPAPRSTVANDGSIRPLDCIAPGCPNPNKGPRTGYTCDEHKGASKSEKESWRSRFIKEVRARLHVPPQKKVAIKRVPRAASRVASAEKAAKIINAIRARGKSGASLHDIEKATRFPLDFIRGKLWRLRKRGQVKVIGKTSRARYFAN